MCTCLKGFVTAAFGRIDGNKLDYAGTRLLRSQCSSKDHVASNTAMSDSAGASGSTTGS